MMANKPKSMVAVYSMLDENKNALEIDGKGVYFCVMRATQKGGSVDSLKAPTNIIQPTKSNDYQHNTETNDENMMSDEMLTTSTRRSSSLCSNTTRLTTTARSTD